jgi:hypothetical protein
MVGIFENMLLGSLQESIPSAEEEADENLDLLDMLQDWWLGVASVP